MWWWLAVATGAASGEEGLDPTMKGHFEKATTAMLATALGQLETAREEGVALAGTSGLPTTVGTAAAELGKCHKVRCATAQVAAMGTACAECHLETGRGPNPRLLDAIPGESVREKHIYAATFAWVGLVTPKQPLLLFGLANVVPPVEREGGSKELQEVRDAFRVAQQGLVAAEALEDRQRAFGALLDACAACHASMNVPSAPAPAP